MLLIGYGNRGRGDDGLGPVFAARIAKAVLPGVHVDIDYQLTVDHALSVAAADRVVFVDALMGSDEPYRFSRVVAADAADLTSHSLSPAAVLTLADTLYGKAPDAYVLGIAGDEFGEVREGIGSNARRNLERAEAFFLEWHGRRQGRDSRLGGPTSLGAHDRSTDDRYIR